MQGCASVGNGLLACPQAGNSFLCLLVPHVECLKDAACSQAAEDARMADAHAALDERDALVAGREAAAAEAAAAVAKRATAAEAAAAAVAAREAELQRLQGEVWSKVR